VKKREMFGVVFCVSNLDRGLQDFCRYGEGKWIDILVL
jgi:hypothetical protein